MRTQKMLLLPVLFMILSQVPTFAQDASRNPVSDLPKERVRIRPAGLVSSKPAPTERAPDTAVQPEKEFVPTRHLWGDLNNDGLEELFVLDQGGNLLFRNLGDEGFEDLTASAFLNGAGSGGTGFLGDYNGDELLDLFLFSGEGFTLWRNEGKLRFRDVTETLGLPSGLVAAQVKLKDYNNDGYGDLLVQTSEGDRIFRNREGREFSEVVPGNGLKRKGLKRKGLKRSSGTGGAIPPIPSPGGPASPGLGSSGSPTWDAIYVNDNSPGSVGIGVPEVEGGDDGTTLNDILDGTITGSDIQNGSVPAAKVAGTAATLTGSQNFDSGTLYIDATNDRVGLGTTSPSIASLHVVSDETYGCRVETSKSSGLAVYGRASATAGIANGVYGESESTSGRGLYGRARASTGTTYGVRGESESTSGRGVYGLASAASGENYGVKGHSSSTSGRGVHGESPYIGIEGQSESTSGTAYGVYGESASTSGHGVYGLASATGGTNYGIKGESLSSSGCGVHGSSPNVGVTGYSDAASGTSYGVYGSSTSTSGRGLFGQASAGTGTTYGMRGESFSTSGRGVYGWASSSTGTTYGVKGYASSSSGCGVSGKSPFIGIEGYSTNTSSMSFGVIGESASTYGRGVFGRASASTGTTYGVCGESDSTTGRGVYGKATAYTGVNYGLRGESPSESGRGVYGWASSPTGTTYGIKGESSSDSGRGVYGSSSYIGVEGYGNNTLGVTFGVYGQASAETSRGVYGEAWATNGNAYGVYGANHSSMGTGVYGISLENSGSTSGVMGYNYSTSGRGVYGFTSSGSGTNYAVRGITYSSSGYGVFSVGDLGCSGTKYFVQPHPADPSKEIRFVCLEGNESGTYFRGTAELKSGRAVIEVPEEFRLVTEEEGLTVQVTPMGLVRMGVEEKSLNGIVIVGEADVTFDYFVNGVRKGFAKFEPIRENHEWVPEYKDRPFGTQYPEALRRILVENGTLNPDFTPNRKTAARMGWELRDFEEENARLLDAKEKRERLKRLSEGDRKDSDEPEEWDRREHKRSILDKEDIKPREKPENLNPQEPGVPDLRKEEPVKSQRKIDKP